MPRKIEVDSDGLKCYSDGSTKVNINAPSTLASDTQLLLPSSSGTVALTSDITGGSAPLYASVIADTDGDLGDTPVTVAGMTVAVAATKRYEFEGLFILNHNASNHNARYVITAPSGAVLSAIVGIEIAGIGSASDTQIVTAGDIFLTDQELSGHFAALQNVVLSDNGATSNWAEINTIRVSGILTTTGAGNVEFKLSNVGVRATAPKLKAGSFMKLTEIA